MRGRWRYRVLSGYYKPLRQNNVTKGMYFYSDFEINPMPDNVELISAPKLNVPEKVEGVFTVNPQQDIETVDEMDVLGLNEAPVFSIDTSPSKVLKVKKKK